MINVISLQEFEDSYNSGIILVTKYSHIDKNKYRTVKYSSFKNPYKILQHRNIYLFNFHAQRLIKPKWLIKINETNDYNFYLLGLKELPKKLLKYMKHISPEEFI